MESEDAAEADAKIPVYRRRIEYVQPRAYNKDLGSACFPTFKKRRAYDARGNGSERIVDARALGSSSEDNAAASSSSSSSSAASAPRHYAANEIADVRVRRLATFEPFEPEMHNFLEQLLEVVDVCERLSAPNSVAARDERCHAAALNVNRRLFLFGINYRADLNNEQRMCVWMARLRCIRLASLCRGTKKTALCACVPYSSRRDCEQRAAHGILLSPDREEHCDPTLLEWATRHKLMQSVYRRNLRTGILNASLATLWKAIVFLTYRWIEMPYSAQLVAYVSLLLQRVATFASYAVRYTKLDDDVFRRTTAVFNNPAFVQRDEKTVKDEKVTIVRINEDFLRITESTFYALEHEMMRASMHVHWRTPALSLAEKNDLEKHVLSPKLHRGCMERMEELISEMLLRPSVEESELARAEGRQLKTSYVDYIERDFQQGFYDYVLLPGEWERFQSLRPYDDRRAMTCVSRMRQTDFDRYQADYMNKPIEDVWAALIRGNKRSHPAYSLIAERALFYYFDEHYEGSSLDRYLIDANDFSVQTPTVDGKGDSQPCEAFRDPEIRTGMSRGTARYILTQERRGHYSAESVYPHPLLLRLIGSFVVTNTRGEVVAPRRSHSEQNFCAAFAHWVHAMCADSRILGVLPTGISLAPLLEKIRPHGADSVKLAQHCVKRFERLREKRYELANIAIEPAEPLLAIEDNKDRVDF